VRRRAATVKLIRACARRSTHVVPHYNVVSAPVQGRGAFRAVQNFLRAFLVEGVYRRVATMFAVTREAEK
jgi:KUP system potassium uptake protein